VYDDNARLRRRPEHSLRSPDWIEDYGAHVGGYVYLDMPHMGAEGLAEVLSIDPAPEIEPLPEGCDPSEYRLVTGTFRHTSGEVYDLKLASESKPIGVTGSHPFWSVDRETWVSVLDLEIGETLKTLEGTTVVESRVRRPGSEPVYNIEVEGDHVYRVGESGVLVHNASIPTKAPKAGVDYGCGSLSGSGNLSRDVSPSLTSNLGSEPSCVSGTPSNVPCKHEAHHLIGVEQAENSLIMQWAAMLGYNINRAHNGEYYPSYGKNYGVTKQQAREYAHNHAHLPLHKGPHHGPLVNYTPCVEQHLSELERRYRAGTITDCDLCDEIAKIETKLRSELQARNIWLHRDDLHPNVVAKAYECNT